jgi:hypothetical protein
MTWFSPFSTHFTSFLLGVLVHLGLFIREEWHLRAPAILLVHLSSIGCGTFLYSILWGLNSTLSGLLLTLSLFCSYSLGLFGSIGIYRMFFHRLRHFPGPRLAALTKLWHVYQCRDSRNHLLLDSLYKKYGSFVRTGE